MDKINTLDSNCELLLLEGFFLKKSIMIGHPNDDDGRVGDYVFLQPIYKADVNDVSNLTKHKIFLKKNDNDKRVFDAEYNLLKISMEIEKRTTN